MTKVLVSAAIIAASGLALAKLPPPDEATKAKTAEAAAKAAWQDKVAAYKQCKVEDKLAAQHGNKGKPAPAAAAASSAAAPAPAAAGTPVAYTPPPPCADPGPLADAPAEQKPLETSEAHSPAAKATSPPSVRAESGTMAPAK